MPLQPSHYFGAGREYHFRTDASKSVAQPWTYSNARDTFGTLRAEYEFPRRTHWLGCCRVSVTGR